MDRRIAFLAPALLVIPLIWGSAAFAQSSQTSESVWDGVYTNAQATRGEQLYTQHCVECHEPNLQGNGEAPALVGGQFVSDFDGETLG
ncbi:MAG: c-type cytochrome, partial [Steroidobacteraceae bacterium]